MGIGRIAYGFHLAQVSAKKEMKRLTNPEYRRLMECIAELYEHDDLHRLKQRLPAIVAKLVPAEVTFLNTFNLQHQDLPAIYSACPENTDLNFEPDFARLVYQDHPCLQHIAQTKSMEAVKITDFMSSRQYRQTRLYAEGLRLFGVEYNIGFQVLEPALPEITSVSQVRDTRDFSESDRLKLNLLRVHVGRAYVHAMQLAEWRARATIAAEALAVTRQAVIVAAPDGSIAFCTDVARVYLGHYFENEASQAKSLPARLCGWMREQELPDTRSGRVPQPRRPFVVERDGSRLTVHFVSSAVSSHRLLLLEEERSRLTRDSLQKKLGLTARRAEVLLWIAQGKTSEEIAIILGLKTRTVHKHTERIFEKLNVENRTAAALLAMEAVATG